MNKDRPATEYKNRFNWNLFLRLMAICALFVGLRYILPLFSGKMQVVVGIIALVIFMILLTPKFSLDRILWVWIPTSIVAVLILIMYYSLYANHRKQNTKKVVAKSEIQQKNEQIKALEKQLQECREKSRR